MTRRVILAGLAGLFIVGNAIAEDPQRLLERGMSPCNAQYVAEAVKLGANPNFAFQAKPALSRCVTVPAIVQIMLSAGADVEAAGDEYGTTTLMQAARTGTTRTVELLLAARAKPDTRSKSNVTALMYAAENPKGYNMLLRLLAAGANPNAADKFEKTPLIYAARSGNLANMQALIAAGANVNTVAAGRSVLWAAVETKRYAAIDLLANSGADVDASIPTTLLNAKNPDGVYTPLMSAVTGGDEKLVELLLALGADRNIRDFNGRTPLEIARDRGEHAVVILLATS